MNILEALEEAKNTIGVICRQCTPTSRLLVRQNPDSFMFDSCVLYTAKETPSFSHGWRPTVEDLTATDWEVYRHTGR